MCAWKWLIDRKSFLLAVILAYLIGLGLATDWELQIGGTWVWDVSFSTQLETEKSAWDILAAIGSVLAGGGTICLFIFGLLKSNEWKKEMLLKDKREALFGWYLEALSYTDSVNTELASRLSKYRVYARSNEDRLKELNQAKRKGTENVDELSRKQKELASYTRSLMVDCARAQNTLLGLKEKLNRRGKLLLANFPENKTIANQINSSVDYSFNPDGENYFLRDFFRDPRLLRQNIERMKTEIDKVLEEVSSEL